MDLFEANTHVFIIRFWLEPREIEGAEQKWRGVIEHVPTGERRYFQHIEEIPKKMAPYLKRSTMDLIKHKSVCQWMKRFNFPKSK